jgi:hypothetical protein
MVNHLVLPQLVIVNGLYLVYCETVANMQVKVLFLFDIICLIYSLLVRLALTVRLTCRRVFWFSEFIEVSTHHVLGIFPSSILKLVLISGI